MRPAGPLLVLTIAQGLAGGIIISFAVLLWLGVLTAGTADVLVLAAVGTAALGGIGSFYHMHNLKAARYVLRRLKTSWLSREALTTGLFGGALAVLAAWTLVDASGMSGAGYQIWTGLTVFVGLVAMWVTAMLYATIPAMLSWHSPLTVLNLMMVGVTSGVGIAAGWAPHAAGLWVGFIVWVALTGAVKWLHWQQFRKAHGQIRAETATGLPFSPYRLQDTGTTKAPYRTQTQVWPLLHPGLRNGVKVWTVGWLFVLPIVAVVVWLTGVWTGARWVVLVSAILGVLGERWLFFADATHSSRAFFEDQQRVAPRIPMVPAKPRAASKGSPARRV